MALSFQLSSESSRNKFVIALVTHLVWDRPYSVSTMFRFRSFVLFSCCVYVTLIACSFSVNVNGQDIYSFNTADLNLYGDAACSQALPSLAPASSLEVTQPQTCRLPPSQWMSAGISSYTGSCANISDQRGWDVSFNLYTWSTPKCPSLRADKTNYTLIVYRSRFNAFSNSQCTPLDITTVVAVDGDLSNTTTSTVYASYVCKTNTNHASFKRANSGLIFLLIFVVIQLIST